MSLAGYGNTQMNTRNLENFSNQIRINDMTTTGEVNNMVSSYYSNLQNYLTPSMANLQLIQNVNPGFITSGETGGNNINNYSDSLGDGFSSNLGFLNGVSYPPVNYGDARADKLSKCAKELPMFAASSLLPKPSTNSNNNALSQSAARALAAFTALGPVEQIGAITSDGSVYSKISDLRALPQIQSTQSAMFYTTPNTTVGYGQVQMGPDGIPVPGSSGFR